MKSRALVIFVCVEACADARPMYAGTLNHAKCGSRSYFVFGMGDTAGDALKPTSRSMKEPSPRFSCYSINKTKNITLQATTSKTSTTISSTVFSFVSERQFWFKQETRQ
jgi:hypothetical protein